MSKRRDGTFGEVSSEVAMELFEVSPGDCPWV